MARKSDRPCVYQVAWPDGVFKVGATRTGRYRKFLSLGGRLVGLDFYDTEVLSYDAERGLHEVTMQRYWRAFRTSAESLPYLGHGGGGWRECYRIDIPMEVSRG